MIREAHFLLIWKIQGSDFSENINNISLTATGHIYILKLYLNS